MFVRFHLEHMTKFFSVIKQCFGRRANHDSMANADEIRGSSPAKSGIKEYEHRAGGDKIDGVISGVSSVSGVQETWSIADCQIALRTQSVLKGVPEETLRTLAEKCRVVEYKMGDFLTKQDSHGDDVFFIAHGEIGVYVNERLVAYGMPGECEGEVLALNTLRRRSASLKAEENTTVLVVDVKTLAYYFDAGRKNEPLLYNEAVVLSERLRDRSKFHKRPNEIPVVFIGSSSEAYLVAKRLRKLIEITHKAKVLDWTDGVFLPSRSSMENLERIAEGCDFAIMVLSGDDRTSFRGADVVEPRDNCVFELGLFMGKLGKTRAFFLVDDAKIPTDLHGETYLKYKSGKRMRLSKAVTRLIEEFDTQGGR